MKNKSLIILLITLLSILVVGLIVFMISMLNGNFMFKNFIISSKVSNKLVLDETYDNIFTKVKIKTSASDIYIKEAITDEVKIVIYGDKDKISVKTENNELVIELVKKKCVGLCFNIEKAKIEVYIPSNNEGIIDINNDYGNVEIDRFLKMNINIAEECGDVTVLSGNKVDIENSYGDIEVGNAHDITIKNDYGDITIDKVTNYLNISEAYGDVEIGQVSLKEDSHIKNNLGNIEIERTDEIYIDASTDLGKVKIKNNYPKAEITLKIDNDCGDIEVNN